MILPVILSGGAGTRLWPMSTPQTPKQLLPLVGETTMLEATAARFQGAGFAPPAVICNAAHAAEIARQVPDGGAIILEPVGRNTAAAAALAAFHAQDAGAELVFLAPADHHISDPGAFRAAALAAAPAARDGWIVTFGIAPDRPETGYGYIRMGEILDASVHQVAAFVEKPDRATAQAYLADGGYAWNAGLFLFRPDTLVAEMERHCPDIVEAVGKAWEASRPDGRHVPVDASRFAKVRSDSLDYAVMEPTSRAACLRVDMGWTDIGSFGALRDARPRDAHGNSLPPGTVAVEAADNLVVTDGPRVSLAGVSGIGVIVRNGEVLVVDLDRSQTVKQVAEAHRDRIRPD